MDINALIAKYLNKECSPDETEELNRWKNATPENDLIFSRSEEAWLLAHDRRKHIFVDKEKIWSRICQHITHQYPLPVMLRVAGIAASVALVIGFTLSQLFTDESPQNIQPQKITLYVPGGGYSKMVLPDSTIVWLNASSSITYPSFFDGDTRTIELVGEAFFDVKRDETKPFIINSGNLRVNVLGTSFNFKHYADDTHAVLAVETGKVTLSAGAGAATSLDAGKYATVDNRTLRTVVRNMTPTTSTKKTTTSLSQGMKTEEKTAGQFSSWRKNKMIFRDEPFNNVLNELARRYNAEFEIQGDEIMDYIYTATFDDMSLDDILKLLKLSAPIDYKVQNLTSNNMNAYGKRKVTIFRK